ncbi:hypothetical protein SADUNF_Sadunf01G0175600 [Salix dunnii]|uniref:MORF/ORRM1/DAG-like MORF domain-containing protein n=1 Tax=Salix dunnii TaxID=1413687 RepID=A0A835NBP6_9ROSI|nr:hypothetical protein SADUNF_Sadunf01G0175600 [Salix dunnii]
MKYLNPRQNPSIAMAQRLLRLRRALTPLSSARKWPPLPTSIAISSPAAQTPPIISKWRGFSRTRVSMMSTTGIVEKQYKVHKDGDEVVKNTILFEGNEYIHWLVTVDFPKEPKPSHEEMVAAFERICAQGLNISIEEAKKRMYACSTTIYQGFQVSITQQEAEKFKGVPGAVFVSPDSRVNKENGGDKYKNGAITPRPTPVQYQRGGESRRDPGRSPPRFDHHESPISNHQGQPQYSQQGHMQGSGSNYGSQQNGPPQQNHGPPGLGGTMPMNIRDYAPGGRNTYPGQQGYNQGNHYPTGQQGYNQGQQGNHYDPDQRSVPQGDWRDYGCTGQRDFRRDNWNYSPTHGGNYGQGGSTRYGKQHPGEGQRSAQLEQRGMQGEQGNYAPVRQPGLSNQFSQQGHMQRGGNCHGSSQNGSPQQDHGPPGLGGRTPMNNRDYVYGGRNMYPGQQGNYYPPGQQGYFQRQQENDYPPVQQVYFQEHQENYYPPGQQGYNQGQQGYFQGQQGNHYPPGQQGYNQGQQGNHYGPDQRSSTQGDWRDHGSPGQRDYRGDNWNYSPTRGGNYRQGEKTSYGQHHPGEGQRSSQMEQMGMQGEQGNYAPLGPPGWSQREPRASPNTHQNPGTTMAQRLLRPRRTLTPLSSTWKRPPLSAPMAIGPPSARTPPIISQWRGLSGTRVSMMSTAEKAEKPYWVYENLGEIPENKTLFEGCDYNYWLVTVDFPREEPKPSPREMIAAYERICAQGLNTSIEEAKKRLYACSTTTFQGFQVLMTEQESKQFRDVPRVVFVLPDSPGNKEYEGDEYEHRMITPRPPSVQFQRGGERCHDQGRIPPRFNQQDSPIPNNQGLQPQYSQQGRMPGGGGNYGSQQNGPPQQNHGLGGKMSMNNRDCAPGGRNTYPGQQGYNQEEKGNHYSPGQQGYNPGQQGNHYPPGQQGYNQEEQGNHHVPDQSSFPQGDWRDRGSPGQRDYRGDNWNYSPTHIGNYGQGRIPPRSVQRESPIPNYQGSQPQYSQQGCMQGGGSNYGSQQNGPPQHYHGPPGLGRTMPMNNRDYAPAGRNTYPGQQGYNQGEQGGGSNDGSLQNGPLQQNHGSPGLGGRMAMNNRDYALGGRNAYPRQQGNHDPRGQQGYNQGEQGSHYPPGQRSYNPEQQGNHYPPGQGYNQGQQGDHYNPDQRSCTQGDWRVHESPGQRDYRGDNWNYSPTHGGNYGQGENTSYGQRHPGEGQRSAQMEQMGMQGEQGNYAPLGPHVRRTPH